MPLRDYQCVKCKSVEVDVLIGHQEPSPMCYLCGKPMEAVLSTHKSYTIKDSNSSSVTPKRYRKGSNNE